MKNYRNHELFFSENTFDLAKFKSERYFETSYWNVLDWICEYATDSFCIDDREYYWAIAFKSEIDAMAYKLRWE